MLLLLILLSLQSQSQSRSRAGSRSRAFARLRRASTPFFACAKKGGPKRRFSTAEWLVKHTLPTRLPRCALQVHSAGRIFRRYILVSSKNDVRPARRPVRGLVCQLRRCGRGPVDQELWSNCRSNGRSSCSCNCKAKQSKAKQRHPSLALPYALRKGGEAVKATAATATATDRLVLLALGRTTKGLRDGENGR